MQALFQVRKNCSEFKTCFKFYQERIPHEITSTSLAGLLRTQGGMDGRTAE